MLAIGIQKVLAIGIQQLATIPEVAQGWLTDPKRLLRGVGDTCTKEGQGGG